MWWVYLIETEKGQLYTGISRDVDRRFQEHLDTANGKPKAKGAKFFRSQKPLRVIARFAFDDRSQASKEEHRIKCLSAAQKRRLATI